jgi:hypothetical protein
MFDEMFQVLDQVGIMVLGDRVSGDESFWRVSRKEVAGIG